MDLLHQNHQEYRGNEVDIPPWLKLSSVCLNFLPCPWPWRPSHSFYDLDPEAIPMAKRMSQWSHMLILDEHKTYLICFFTALLTWQKLKKNYCWGAWVAQLVNHPTSAQVMISQFMNSSPTSGSALTVRSLLGFSVSLSLCSSPAHTLPPLSKINI